MRKIATITLLTCGVFAHQYGQALPNTESFLTQEDMFSSLNLLPAPPALDSITFVNDKIFYENNKVTRRTERGAQAEKDADTSSSNIGQPFSDALGIDISQQNTPKTHNLLIRLYIDVGDLGTKEAKTHYLRMRPFAFFDDQSCTAKEEEGLRKNGSYPSGHAAYGWASALVLTEIAPQRQDQLLKRGYNFAQSRVICGVHWQSDVDAGRIIGAAVLARLHADPEFLKAVQEAKEEIQQKILEKQ